MRKRKERKTVYIGSDHAGFALKQEIKKFLTSQGYLIEDIGPYKFNKEDDYPDFALKVCQRVLKAKSKGILICGTGQGMSIAANKVPRIRAAFCWDNVTAVHASEHLNSNILCLGSSTLKINEAKKLVKIWLETSFLSKEKRHSRRINKIKAIERKYLKIK